MEAVKYSDGLHGLGKQKRELQRELRLSEAPARVPWLSAEGLAARLEIPEGAGAVTTPHRAPLWHSLKTRLHFWQGMWQLDSSTEPCPVDFN